MRFLFLSLFCAVASAQSLPALDSDQVQKFSAPVQKFSSPVQKSSLQSRARSTGIFAGVRNRFNSRVQNRSGRR